MVKLDLRAVAIPQRAAKYSGCLRLAVSANERRPASLSSPRPPLRALAQTDIVLICVRQCSPRTPASIAVGLAGHLAHDFGRALSDNLAARVAAFGTEVN